MRPAPEPKVSELLVSKDYFQAASNAFLGNQKFDENATLSTLFGFKQGLIAQYLTSFTTRLSHLKFSNGRLTEVCPNLKVLIVEVAAEDFELIEPRFAWVVELTDMEIQAVIGAACITGISGLREIHTTAAKLTLYAKSESQQAIWKTNVSRLRDLLRPLVTRPRKDVPSDGEHLDGNIPLYRGSRVLLRAGPHETGEPRKRSLFAAEPVHYLKVKEPEVLPEAQKPPRHVTNHVPPPLSREVLSEAQKPTDRIASFEHHGDFPWDPLEMPLEAPPHDSPFDTNFLIPDAKLTTQDLPRTADELESMVVHDSRRMIDFFNELRNSAAKGSADDASEVTSSVVAKGGKAGHPSGVHQGAKVGEAGPPSVVGEDVIARPAEQNQQIKAVKELEEEIRSQCQRYDVTINHLKRRTLARLRTLERRI